MRPLSWAIVLAVVNIPLYVLVGTMFFGTWDSFLQATRFRPSPGFAFLFRWESWKEWRADLKLALFAVACAAMVYGEYLGIQALVRR